jgi:hypothetical protein
MEITGAINGVLFLIVTLVQIVLSLLVLSYAGYSFLTVFVNTSAGTDEVLWPKDPFQDWIWKSWYLAWLMDVWAIPAWFLGNFLNTPDRPWIFIPVVLGFLWLMFPIGLLSSMSASTQWVVLRPVIVRLFVSNIFSTLAFYIVSGALVAGLGVLTYYCVLGSFYFVPVTAFSAAAVALIYPRLLGRVGWVFTQQQIAAQEQSEEDDDDPPAPRFAPAPPPAPKQAPKKGAARSAPQRPNRNDQTESQDAWSASLERALRKGTKPAPPSTESADPYRPSGGPYGMLPEDGSWRRASAARREEEKETVSPFSIASSGGAQGPKYPSFALPEADDPPPEQKPKDMAIRHEVPPPPSWPLWSGVYSFPFYPTTLGAFAVLAMGFLGMIILFRTQVDFWPGGPTPQ